MAPLISAGRREAALALLACLALGGCSRHDRVDAATLVGKWHSSRLATPIHLLGNGDWEIRTDDGALLQYGVWELEGRLITWSHKSGRQIEHDVNEVLSATRTKWTLRERDGSVTTFERLD